MGNFKASNGDVFGDWTVVGLGNWGKTYYYICEHMCGAKRKYRSFQLNSEKQPCKKCEAGKYRMQEDTIAVAKQEYRKCKDQARRRKIIFDIDFKDYLALVEANCKYCSRPPYDIKVLDRRRGSDRLASLNGLDRMDSSIGYTLENVAPACWICNRAKNTLTVEEWNQMVELWHQASRAKKESVYVR